MVMVAVARRLPEKTKSDSELSALLQDLLVLLSPFARVGTRDQLETLLHAVSDRHVQISTQMIGRISRDFSELKELLSLSIGEVTDSVKSKPALLTTETHDLLLDTLDGVAVYQDFVFGQGQRDPNFITTVSETLGDLPIRVDMCLTASIMILNHDLEADNLDQTLHLLLTEADHYLAEIEEKLEAEPDSELLQRLANAREGIDRGEFVTLDDLDKEWVR